MLIHKIIHRIFFTLAAGLALTSCYTAYDLKVCDYNVQLNYHYNMENTTTQNMIDRHIGAIDQYIFDANNVLLKVVPVSKENCNGRMVSEITLPPGRYSVVSWGNPGPSCGVNRAVPGQTTREEMMMMMDNPCGSPLSPDGYNTNTDRLYHSYRTFTVPETGITRMRIDMTHSHLVLKFRIRWRANAPDNTDDFAARMRDVSSEYDFMPEFISREERCRPHDCEADDDYRTVCNEVIHHIPRVHQERETRNHNLDVKMTADREIHGEFVTFRVRNGYDIVMSLHSGSPDRTRSAQEAADDDRNNVPDPDGTMRVMKPINLRRFFESYNIDLDRTLRQEYALDFLIDGDRVTVSGLDIADWEEGGSLTTKY